MRTSWLHLEKTGNDPRVRVERGRFDYSLVTAPAMEPVTLAEAKLFARIDPSGDAATDTATDALIESLITSARQSIEGQTRRALISQTWKATLDFIPNAAEYDLMPRPLIDVTSIKAYNEDGTSTEMNVSTDLILDTANATIGVKSTAATLDSDRRTKVFEIVYTAGYGTTAADVPEWAKLAIKQLVSSWYENRESEVVGTIVSKIPFVTQMIIDTNTVIEV